MKIFFSKTERYRYRRNLRIKIYLYLGGISLIAILVFYAILNLPFLKIKEFEIGEGVKFEEARAKILNSGFARVLGFKNFLSWPSKISNIEVEKKYSSGKLALSGKPMEKFAIWCADSCYWVNREGITLEEAPDTEGSAIPKIIDDRNVIPVLSKAVLTNDLFLNALKIIEGINKLAIRVINYEFNDRLQELTANGARGERLIFSLRYAPSAKAFNYLANLMSSGKIQNAEYVDLTVENRIYFKPK